MEFRLAREADLPHIMAIVRQAQAHLGAQGIDQWQDGYPDEATLRRDIALSQGYVLEGEAGIEGIATIVFTGEPCYVRIEQGAWKTSEPYACIHRVALRADLRGSGASARLMRAAEAVVRAHGFPSIRIDTHRQNLGMQKMLAKQGYTCCGVIYLENGAERLALEKAI